MLVCIYTCKLVWKIVFKKKKTSSEIPHMQCEGHTVIERLEVADELNIFINRGFFGVNGPSQHMTAELHVTLSWRQKRKRDYNYLGKKNTTACKNMLFMCSTKFMSSPAASLWQAVSSHYGDVFEIWIIFNIIYLSIYLRNTFTCEHF